jgi:O-antigen ligase
MRPLFSPSNIFSRLYVVLFALLPWSLECSFGTWKLNLPSEPLMVVVGIGLAVFFLKNPSAIRAAFSKNLVLKISLVWIGWLALSACFSTMPVVSWKYWVVEMGHWWVFAVGLAVFPDLWPKAIRLFVLSMTGMVVYTLAHHSFYDFRADQALLAPMPFFPENTLYAAVLAMVLVNVQRPISNVQRPTSNFQFPLAFLFLTGLFFSFCRAAWASVLMIGIVCFFLIIREKQRWVAMSAGGFLLIIGFASSGWLLHEMRKDVSMLERLNRFSCAWRMAQERPLTGFGTGTFQFEYIPFQKTEEMTRISAKKPVLEKSPDTYGRGGGAHSEFFQALAETGWPGLAIWAALVFAVLWQGFKRFFQKGNKENQAFALALTLSLLTFFLHGIFNNMLHDGRIAALFWTAAVAVFLLPTATADCHF